MDSKVVVAYAILARDPVDFVDYVNEELNEEERLFLIKMLELPNSEHSLATVELNRLGVALIKDDP